MNIKNAGLTLPSVMLMSSVTILAGCMNGVYTVDSKIDYDDEKAGGAELRSPDGLVAFLQGSESPWRYDSDFC